MQRFEHERHKMVEQQLRARGIVNERVLQAMRTVPREAFVPEEYRDYSYRDGPLPIEAAQTISQPYIVALMLQALDLEPTHRVLEVGAGSGYAAAVLSRLVGEVYAIEYHEELARLARERMQRLAYDNVDVMQGDGTRGWPAHAPYDAILVSAGGPDVPPTLLSQLRVGGCMVIPVGDRVHSQELLRVRRTAEHAFEEESLGRVQFVPLVGAEGWRAGAPPAPEKPPHTTFSLRRVHLAKQISDAAEPFESLDTVDLAPLLRRIGDARVVLIGEATHGTSEFYRLRARITQALIEEHGFRVVALESDWPDTAMLDRYVRTWDGPDLPSPPFSRFPVWMWRNRETLSFVDWLAAYNRAQADPVAGVSMHGLDLYSLYHSIHAVLTYLERVDPAAAARARERYACFSPWERDPAVYGRATVAGERGTCEAEVIATLQELLAHRLAYRRSDGESLFYSERNASVVAAAERYYRFMYYGSRESWNLRDRHMFDTLKSVMAHRGESTRAVVWAHNSHVGDASASEMGMRGEWSIGQLAREAWGDAAYLIGFGTDHGTVAAASDWDGPMAIKTVRPALPDSYEHVFHHAQPANLFLPLRHAKSEKLLDGLRTPRLHRAIGVIYRPDTERVSHYIRSVLPRQFDEYIWFDATRAVTPLGDADLAGLPAGHPLHTALLAA
jgi:protein-L-isoaspartate(D-aspartate) O-methyltransferase